MDVTAGDREQAQHQVVRAGPRPLTVVQRILETARLAMSPGNLQPWRAVVVIAADLDAADRRTLLEADNRQRAHELAPVWIYWYGARTPPSPQALPRERGGADRDRAIPEAFALVSVDSARASILEGEPSPPGTPGARHLRPRAPR